MERHRISDITLIFILVDKDAKAMFNLRDKRSESIFHPGFRFETIEDSVKVPTQKREHATKLPLWFRKRKGFKA